jgi:GntR family transcriptional regulator, transcriptional repressor for pyruvate dehydrogenase complex
MSQTDVVLQGIKAMITGGQLKAGSQLPIERDLSEALGVSRGALREGVRALCIMGVLETRRGVGTFVRSLDSRLLLAPMAFMIDLQTAERRELYAVRCVLEPEAAGRAALTMTPEQLTEATTVLDAAHSRLFANRDADHETIAEADAAFHRMVARASDNRALAALVDALTDTALSVRREIGAPHIEQARRAHRGHAAILDALRQGDPDRARLLMSHHLLVDHPAASA